MKKIKLYLSVILLASACAMYAQDNFNLSDSYYTLSSVFVKNLEVNASGTVKAYLLKQYSADKLDAKAILTKEASLDFYNSFCEYTFDATLNGIESKCLPYTNFGGIVSSKIAGISVDKQIKTDSLGAVINQYPNFFKRGIAPPAAIFPRTDGFQAIDFVFDRSLGEYCSNPEFKVYSPGKAKTKMIKLEADKIGMANPLVGTYTQLEGIPDPLKKDYARIHKHYMFSTFNSKNELVDSFSVMFQYPQEINAKMLVYSKTDRDKIEGVLFVFNRTGMYSKKLTDPVRNYHEVVFIGNDGKLIFHSRVRIGDDVMNALYPWYAFYDAGVITLFNDFWCFKESGLYNVKFNADSSVYHKYISYSDAVKLPVYKENIGDALVGEAAENIGRYWKGIDEYFVGFGHQVLENGDILLWGRVSQKKSQTSTTGTGVTSTTYYFTYKDFTCLRYNKDLDFVEQYASPLDITKDENRNEVISYSSDGKLSFILMLPNYKTSFFRPEMVSLNDARYHLFYKAGNAYKVKLINLNITGGKTEIKSNITPENFSVFFPGSFYSFNNNNLYLIGFQQVEKSQTIKLLKYSL